jgi:hypothetical protein
MEPVETGAAICFAAMNARVANLGLTTVKRSRFQTYRGIKDVKRSRLIATARTDVAILSL